MWLLGREMFLVVANILPRSSCPTLCRGELFVKIKNGLVPEDRADERAGPLDEDAGIPTEEDSEPDASVFEDPSDVKADSDLEDAAGNSKEGTPAGDRTITAVIAEGPVQA